VYEERRMGGEGERGVTALGVAFEDVESAAPKPGAAGCGAKEVCCSHGGGGGLYTVGVG